MLSLNYDEDYRIVELSTIYSGQAGVMRKISSPSPSIGTSPMYVNSTYFFFLANDGSSILYNP